MNTTQIHYFLTAARTMNFTVAAKQLFISQPALSKQITAIEKELNMQLFIRDKKSLRLTPAGVVLKNELAKVENLYDEIILKAKVANEGNMGELNIGILEGQMVGDEFTRKFGEFTSRYPNISVRLSRNSFSGLRKALEEEKIDLAVTLDFDILGMEGLEHAVLGICPAVAAVSNTHPLAKINPSSWEELKGEVFIALEEKDSFASAKLIIDDCKKAGFVPQIKFAPSLETAMLWIEAGMGIGFINQMNNLVMNPDIKLLDKLPCKNTQTVLAWKSDHINPAKALFTNFYLENQ